MRKLNLANDEVILLEDQSVNYSGNLGETNYVDNLVLTNKRIVGTWTKRRVEYSFELLLSEIKKYNGEVQVDYCKDDEIGECLRIQALDGIQCFAINGDDSMSSAFKSMFTSKSAEYKAIAAWVAKIKEAVQGSNFNVKETITTNTSTEETKANTKAVNVCPECGKEFDKTSNFCPSCGTSVTKQKVVEVEKVVEVIRCRKCGEKMPTNTKFCPSCGTPVIEEVNEHPQVVNAPQVPEKKKDNKPNKCPICGEILPSDAIRCPSCGHEIRGREAVSSVKDFAEKIIAISDEDKKIEAIKMFPIPNTKEDIVEFMLLASSNFDAKLYATNEQGETVAGAWLTKMEQCHKKAVVMFNDPKDLEPIEKIYNQVHIETKSIKKTKLIMTISGIAAIILSLLLLMLGTPKDAEGNTQEGPLSYISMAILAVGIIVLVFGLKKKKTNKQLEEERIAKMNKKNKK